MSDRIRILMDRTITESDEIFDELAQFIVERFGGRPALAVVMALHKAMTLACAEMARGFIAEGDREAARLVARIVDMLSEVSKKLMERVMTGVG